MKKGIKKDFKAEKKEHSPNARVVRTHNLQRCDSIDRSV